jgi:hypothetical protein
MHSEEEQTTQWPKEKVQKDKQRSTKHTHKTKDRVTRTPLKTGDELRCSGRVSLKREVFKLFIVEYIHGDVMLIAYMYTVLPWTVYDLSLGL